MPLKNAFEVIQGVTNTSISSLSFSHTKFGGGFPMTSQVTTRVSAEFIALKCPGFPTTNGARYSEEGRGEKCHDTIVKINSSWR